MLAAARRMRISACIKPVPLDRLERNFIISPFPANAALCRIYLLYQNFDKLSSDKSKKVNSAEIVVYIFTFEWYNKEEMSRKGERRK
jgi:hypothetical protein